MIKAFMENGQVMTFNSWNDFQHEFRAGAQIDRAEVQVGEETLTFKTWKDPNRKWLIPTYKNGDLMGQGIGDL